MGDCFRSHTLTQLAHESFSYGATRSLFNLLEEVSQRSGVSRGQAFEDALTAIVCALAAETMEPEYLAMVERHKNGKPGRRGIDSIAQMFAELVDAMSRTDDDVLGDLFQSAVSHQESGQFLTPDCVSQLLAELTVGDEEPVDSRVPRLVSDPCCGTGRMLLHAARVNPNIELAGQDIDARCVKVTAINMGLRQLYGWVVCGNTLTAETRFAYRIAPFFHESSNGRRRGVIRSVPIEQTPMLGVSQAAANSTRDLFAESESAEPRGDTPDLEHSQTIMEIPRWVARLESHFTDSGQHDSDEHDQPERVASPDGEDAPDLPPTQGQLF